MKFKVTPQHVKRYFPQLDTDIETLVKKLNLDLGHLQLLRDYLQHWRIEDNDTCVLLLCLVDAVNNGSLCLNLNDRALIEFFHELSIQEPLKTAGQADWVNMIESNHPVIRLNDENLYFEKYWQAEASLTQALTGLAKQVTDDKLDCIQINQVIDTLIGDLKFDQVESKQVLAIAMCLINQFNIISGGPGTGKTTIMGTVLRGLIKIGYAVTDIQLAAPTGRAANRMTESLYQLIEQDIRKPTQDDLQLKQLEAVTIHRLLGARSRQGGFRYGLNNKLPLKVLVIDEVSMVDVMLMRQLLQAIPEQCRVILLGDQYQLPSVNSGAVLADLMPPEGFAEGLSDTMWQHLNQVLENSPQQASIMSQLHRTENIQLLTDRVTVLDVSKRNQAHIASISEKIRLGQAREVIQSDLWQQAVDVPWPLLQHSGIIYQSCYQELNMWHEFCWNWLKAHYFDSQSNFKINLEQLRLFDEQQLARYDQPLKQLFNTINSNRVLTLTNGSPYGSDLINQLICQRMQSELGETGFQNGFHGSVVMVRRNNNALKLYNGDVAILLRSKSGQLRLVAPTVAGFCSHSVHVVPAYTSAYAMTIHKSQGSEFMHVLIALTDDADNQLLTRQILYTGITRAKQSVCVYGHKHILEKAIKQQTQRHSGLRFWYNQNK